MPIHSHKPLKTALLALNISEYLSKKMATLSTVIIPSKILKDGKHKVRIAVAHRGAVRYISTDIMIDSAGELSNGVIKRRPDAAFLNSKLRKIVLKYQECLDDLGYIDAMSCAEVVFFLKNGAKQRHCTLRSIFDEYVDVIVKTEGSKTAYTARFRSIIDFIPENTLMKNLTHGMILGLMRHFQKKRNYSTQTIRMRLLFVKTLINYAVKCGYVEYRVNPFNGIPVPQNVIREAWLDVDEIKLIRDVHLVPNSNAAFTRDLFMLSYYLGGINMADLVKINFNDYPNKIRYVRQKTENQNKGVQYVEFDIPEEATKIIQNLTGKNGLIKMTESQRKSCCCDELRRGFITIAKTLDMQKIIFYSARKSFAQHAFSLGVDTAIIDYLLGHSNGKSGCLYNYIKVTPEIATNAIRKVLDNLK